MQRLLNSWAAAAAGVVGLASAIGYLAPWWPIADLPNHFVPFLLSSALIALAGLALGPGASRPRNRFLVAGLAVFAAINAVAIYKAMASTAPAADASARETLTIVSFNVWSKNKRLDEAARWLVDQNADVIVLQEMTATHRAQIKQTLMDAYPHVSDCGCNDVILLSRTAVTGVGGQPRTAVQPAMSWFDLTDRQGRPIRVIGLRPRYIHRLAEHSAQYDWLVRHASELGPRVMVAGDFNAAPWSWQMTRFARAGGLVRHGTFATSYPSLFPLILIDNVLTSPDFTSVSFRTGPALSSGHRPVVATLAWN